MVRLMLSILVAAALLPVAMPGRGVATEPVTVLAESLQRAAPSAGGQKPKEIVVVGSKGKKQQSGKIKSPGGSTTSTDTWNEPQ